MSTIAFRMPFGVQGDITRPSQSTVEAQALSSAAPFASFGLPGKVSAGKFVPVALNNDLVYGFLVRPFPVTGANASDPLGTSVPSASGVASVLRRGYFNVLVQLGGASCALGSNVYIRYQNPSGSQIVAGIEGASTGNTYQLSSTTGYGFGGYFTGPVDGNNIAEIAFNI
jgi:hypothetical protein